MCGTRAGHLPPHIPQLSFHIGGSPHESPTPVASWRRDPRLHAVRAQHPVPRASTRSRERAPDNPAHPPGSRDSWPTQPRAGSLAKLEILALGGNQLAGPIPAWLGSLTNLRKLWLYDNQLAGTIPSELGSLAKLEILALGGNQLAGPIPAWLGSPSPTCGSCGSTTTS